MIRDRLSLILPEQMTVGYGTLYIHTNRGIQYIDGVADWPYINRVTDVGVVTLVVSMLFSIVTLVFVGVSVVRSTPEPTAAQDPVNLLAIPGVNDFLPLAATLYIVLALIIATGVHEFAHAVAMRAADVTVEEVGIVTFLVIPMAAYVMPDEDEYESVPVRGQARILSAGVFANVLVFVVTSLLFLLPVTGSPVTAYVTYFGVIFGSSISGAGSVAGLGVITNVLFWTWFFNLNLAFVNALPIIGLDGGRMAGLIGDVVETPVNSGTTSLAIMGVTTIGTVSVFILAVFGPIIL